MGGPTVPIVADVRYDGLRHYVHSSSQGRCAASSKNTTECAKHGKRLANLEISHTKKYCTRTDVNGNHAPW
jgi:hypothetical protein